MTSFPFSMQPYETTDVSQCDQLHVCVQYMHTFPHRHGIKDPIKTLNRYFVHFCVSRQLLQSSSIE